MQQSVEAAVEFANVSGPIKVEISFDEFVIDAVISYVGLPLQFPETAPSQDELLESEDGALRLSGFLIRRYADKITASTQQRPERDQAALRSLIAACAAAPGSCRAIRHPALPGPRRRKSPQKVASRQQSAKSQMTGA